MNLPNLLTILRIFFVPLLVAALVQEGFWLQRPWVVSKDFIALSIFLLAAATDFLDGYLARRWQQVTTVGTLLDPIADKLLISAALVSLVQIHRVPAWMAVLIIGREFAVSGLRSIASAEGYTIKASELGKTKTALQVVGIALVLLSLRFPFFVEWGLWAMWAAVIAAMVSAIDYFVKFWRKVDDRIKVRRRNELLQLEREKRILVRQTKRANRQARTHRAGSTST
jgi:CDP-diacylglycerol---glycerol-3-phosphate 3-phosphatidyltransferase